MTQQTPLAAPDRIHRECDCPEWVERCAHFMDQYLIIHPGTNGYFAVCGGDVVSFREKRTRPGVQIGAHTDDFIRFYGGYNHDAALAAFHDAEQSLLRGDA